VEHRAPLMRIAERPAACGDRQAVAGDICRLRCVNGRPSFLTRFGPEFRCRKSPWYVRKRSTGIAHQHIRPPDAECQSPMSSKSLTVPRVSSAEPQPYGAAGTVQAVKGTPVMKHTVTLLTSLLLASMNSMKSTSFILGPLFCARQASDSYAESPGQALSSFPGSTPTALPHAPITLLTVHARRWFSLPRPRATDARAGLPPSGRKTAG
jgi:hypothetical protein